MQYILKDFPGFFLIDFFADFTPMFYLNDGWSAGSPDIPFKGNPLRMIQAKLGLNWPSGFRGEDFLKSLQTDDGRRTPIDGNSSYKCAKNCSVGRS